MKNLKQDKIEYVDGRLCILQKELNRIKLQAPIAFNNGTLINRDVLFWFLQKGGTICTSPIYQQVHTHYCKIIYPYEDGRSNLKCVTLCEVSSDCYGKSFRDRIISCKHLIVRDKVIPNALYHRQGLNMLCSEVYGINYDSDKYKVWTP